MVTAVTPAGAGDNGSVTTADVCVTQGVGEGEGSGAVSEFQPQSAPQASSPSNPRRITGVAMSLKIRTLVSAFAGRTTSVW